MADPKIDKKTAALLEELVRRKEQGPHTQTFPETEPDLSAFPPAPKVASHQSKSLISSIPWIHRAREYYPSPADMSKWTEEQRARVTTRSALGSPLGAGVVGLTGGATAGFIISTLQNAVQSHGEGWKGVFTRTGGTITSFALAGGTFGLVDSGMKEYRGKKDAWNKFSAGCAAGFMIGMQGKSLPRAIGMCAFFGTPAAVFELQGGTLRGDGKFEHTSLAGQRAERYTGMFRPPPKTKAEREAEDKAAGMSHEEAAHHLAKHPKTMSPALKVILEERVADS
ncbi:hypothetical protein M408DRAFT_333955 [Serendipita vermifera MAFF 305830]|uniref:Uncharacterized protein n=1 Tax=Serendipita vermifera MAFF 305830 TaxID=933852 RepID=A0A0C3AKE4_SERVB|nr:hypothetical protein M408DRAFT_333955 [Serendipita vermifera MAFF 305830]